MYTDILKIIEIIRNPFSWIILNLPKEKYEMPTAPSVPRRSPIQVLTGLNIA